MVIGRIGDLDVLVAEYVSGAGLSAAARAAGMSKSTAWRRLTSSEGSELVAAARDARRTALAEWSTSLRTLADLALDRLADVLERTDDDAVVVRIASLLLPEVRHAAALADIDQRLADLETALGLVTP